MVFYKSSCNGSLFIAPQVMEELTKGDLKKGEMMKMRNYFILFVVVFVLATALLVHANREHGSGISDEIQSLEKDIERARREEVFFESKITDRDSFLEGVFFAQKVTGNMRNEGNLLGLRAQDDRKIYLEGLLGVEVVVEKISPEVENYGLTEQLLQTDTELRLRQHGIRVGTSMSPQVEKDFERLEQAITDRISRTWLQADRVKSDQEFLQFASAGIRMSDSYPYLFSASELLPTLYINVSAIVFEEIHLAAISIRVELTEAAYLYRNGACCTSAIWKTAGVAGCSSSKLKEYARECLRDILDGFINDYLSANPKDRSSQNEQ